MNKKVAPGGKPLNKETADELARHIAVISESFLALKASRLNERVTHLLIRDITGMGIADIKKVLDALPMLSRKFLK